MRNQPEPEIRMKVVEQQEIFANNHKIIFTVINSDHASTHTVDFTVTSPVNKKREEEFSSLNNGV